MNAEHKFLIYCCNNQRANGGTKNGHDKVVEQLLLDEPLKERAGKYTALREVNLMEEGRTIGCIDAVIFGKGVYIVEVKENDITKGDEQLNRAERFIRKNFGIEIYKMVGAQCNGTIEWRILP